MLFTFLNLNFLQAQFDIPINVIIEEDDTESKFKKEYRMVRAEVIRQISEASQLYNIVERDRYDAIQKERTQTQQMGNDPYISSILNGAAQLIKIKIIDYKEVWDSVQVEVTLRNSVKENPKRDKKKVLDFQLKLEVVYGIQVIDLATTEVKDYRELKAKSKATARIEKDIALEKYNLERSAWHFLRRSMFILNRINLLDMSNLKIPIIEVIESKKQEANKILIVGGARANFQKGIALKVVKTSEIEIRGEKKKREETIGEARISDYGWEMAECRVTDGKKEVFAALNSKENVYCVFSDKNKPAKVWLSQSKKK